MHVMVLFTFHTLCGACCSQIHCYTKQIIRVSLVPCNWSLSCCIYSWKLAFTVKWNGNFLLQFFNRLKVKSNFLGLDSATLLIHLGLASLILVDTFVLAFMKKGMSFCCQPVLLHLYRYSWHCTHILHISWRNNRLAQEKAQEGIYSNWSVYRKQGL